MREFQAAEGSGTDARRLFVEVADHARVTVPEGEFFARFTPHVQAGLAAIASVVWLRTPRGLRMAQQTGFDRTGLSSRPESLARHARLIEHVVKDGRPCLVAPEVGANDGEADTNPTPYQLLLAPLRVGDEIAGLVETFQPADGPATEQRSQLRLLVEFCDIAGQYLQGRRLKSLELRQAHTDQLFHFCEAVHAGLNLHDSALAIANEGKLVTGCDRLSVVVRRGGKAVVEAVSGLDTVEPRSALARKMKELAAAVMPLGEPVLYAGDSSSLAPQVAGALNAFLEESPMRVILVAPLLNRRVDEDRAPAESIGALIVEYAEESISAEIALQRSEPILKHSSLAVANSLQHENLFLLPVWRELGKVRVLVGTRLLPKSLAVMAALLVLVTGLVLIPADLKLEGRGVLVPVERREVFCEVDGKVEVVHVQHGAQVAQDDLLATLHNLELARQIESTEGQRAATVEHLAAVEVALVTGKQSLSPAEEARLHGERLADKQTIKSLGEELELLARKQEQLQVRSPIDGEIVTWNVNDLLIHRPVKRGDELFSVVNPGGAWELQVRMPEERMGHVARAKRASAEPLEVLYVAANQPDEVLKGKLLEAERRAEVRDDEGNTVLLRIAVDRNAVRDLRPGAEVTARINCGRKSLGYVWFHDVIGFVQSRILFRFR